MGLISSSSSSSSSSASSSANPACLTFIASCLFPSRGSLKLNTHFVSPACCAALSSAAWRFASSASNPDCMISRSEVPTAEPFERRAFLAGGPSGVEGEDFAAARCMNYLRFSRFVGWYGSLTYLHSHQSLGHGFGCVSRHFVVGHKSQRCLVGLIRIWCCCLRCAFAQSRSANFWRTDRVSFAIDNNADADMTACSPAAFLSPPPTDADEQHPPEPSNRAPLGTVFSRRSCPSLQPGQSLIRHGLSYTSVPWSRKSRAA